MSLRLDYKNIHDYENYVYITDDDGNVIQENPITVGIGFCMMAVDIGRLTPENIVEFYVRQKILYTLRNVSPFTFEDIRRNIGLSANVATETDRSVWVQRVIAEGIMREFSWDANRKLEALRDEELIKEA